MVLRAGRRSRGRGRRRGPHRQRSDGLQPPEHERRERDPVHRVREQRAVAFDLPDQPRRPERRGERRRRAGRERQRRTAGRCPAGASRTPFSTVAPAITGSATWRESRLASSRVKRRSRAAASVAPLRETPGISAQRLRDPKRERVARAGVLVAARLRRAVGPRHHDRAGDQPAGDRRRGPEAATRSGARACSRRPPAARTTARSGRSRRASRPCSASPTSRAQGDQQCGGGAGVEDDLERLAQLVVELLVVPSSSHGTSATWPEEEIGSSSAGP